MPIASRTHIHLLSLRVLSALLYYERFPGEQMSGLAYTESCYSSCVTDDALRREICFSAVRRRTDRIDLKL